MIEVMDLTKSFDGNLALRGINLEISPGERVAIVGHNGSGKSTFIRCLLGLHVYGGEIRVLGNCPRADRLAVLNQSAFVPQLPPALRGTCHEYVSLMRKVCGGDQRKMRELAARLGLPLDEVIQRPFAKLSGGMKQKLLVAMAFSRDAAVFVLDEPTASLDPDARIEFSKILAELPDKTSVVIVSHRLKDLQNQIGRVIQFDHGLVTDDQKGAVS